MVETLFTATAIVSTAPMTTNASQATTSNSAEKTRKLNRSLALIHWKQEIICKCYKVFPSYVMARLQIVQKLK